MASHLTTFAAHRAARARAPGVRQRRSVVKQIIRQFFRRLAAIQKDHHEISATVNAAVLDGFLRAEPGYRLSKTFALPGREGEQDVRSLMEWFLPAARAAAAAAGLDTFHKRL